MFVMAKIYTFLIFTTITKLAGHANNKKINFTRISIKYVLCSPFYFNVNNLHGKYDAFTGRPLIMNNIWILPLPIKMKILIYCILIYKTNWIKSPRWDSNEKKNSCFQPSNKIWQVSKQVFKSSNTPTP